MQKKILNLVTVLLLLTHLGFAQSNENWNIQKVLIDNQESPINVDQSNPDISWILGSSINNQKQMSYQIQIASSQYLLEKNKPDIWDSGKIVSGQSSHIYIKDVLLSNKDYLLKLITWNQKGEMAFKVTKFSTAYFNPSDWKATWIGYQSEGDIKVTTASKTESEALTLDSAIANRSQYLRKEILINKKVERARVFVSGLGFYELSINGAKIGDHVLAPAKTRYTDQVLYEVFDVKTNLLKGKNAIGIQLGNGWYNTLKKYRDWRMPFWGYPRAILQLEITYTDGSKETILTDQTWKAHYGAIIANCVYDGEHYDARLEQKGWDKPGFGYKGWKNAEKMKSPSKLIQVQKMAPERIVKSFKPIKTYKISENKTVYDIGQNISGWTKIKLSGEKGAKITIRHAEDIKTDHTLDTKTNRMAKNTDVYILKGEGVEEYQPRFTYHGFQYIEITSIGKANILDVQGQFVYTDLAQTSSFDTDNELINKIHQMTLWSQKANMQGYPTDCPQRDERLGWMTDGYVTADEAMLNFDAANFYIKWMEDMRLAQKSDGALPHITPTMNGSENTNWSCGLFQVVWDYYNNYGNKEVLKLYYKTMEAYVSYLEKASNSYILKADRYGDWGNPAQDNKKESGWERGNPKLSTTAMFYYCTDILMRTAKVLDRSADVEKYKNLKDKIKLAFNESYFDTKLVKYNSEEYHYQYAQGIPLFIGLTPDSLRKAALEKLIDDIMVKRQGHIYAGIQGLKYIYELLMAEDRNDVVYSFVTAKGYPGWDDMMKGRNTFPEWWNGTGSHNHIMFGSIDAWFFRALAGIRTNIESAGYQKIDIKPYFPTNGLNRVSAEVETIKGKVKSKWQRQGNQITMQVVIPVNSTADVYLPAISNILIEDKNVNSINEEGYKKITLGSGVYNLSFSI